MSAEMSTKIDREMNDLKEMIKLLLDKEAKQ